MLNKSKYVSYAAAYKFSVEANISANFDFGLSFLILRNIYMLVTGKDIFIICSDLQNITTYIRDSILRFYSV